MVDYYGILQIDETATQEEIKLAYHKMAMLFHPDNFNGSTKVAEEQMMKINQAYEVLSDSERRMTYDKSRSFRENENNQKDQENSFRENKNGQKEQEGFNNNQNVHSDLKYTYTSPNNYTKSQKGCSSCLTSLLKWVIYFGILCYIINHFNLDNILRRITDRGNDFLNENTVNSVQKEGIFDFDNINQAEPDNVVERYLYLIRIGDNLNANKLFSKTADRNFQDYTVKRYNKTIVHIFYGFEEDIPLYPLFEEIRDFEYSIDNISVNSKKKNAKVDVVIKNCDILQIFEQILDTYTNYDLEQLSDYEIQEICRDIISSYKSNFMIKAKVRFSLKKNKNGNWKINSIQSLKDFSNVIIGDAARLILVLNGEEIPYDLMGDDTAQEEEYVDSDLLQ